MCIVCGFLTLQNLPSNYYVSKENIVFMLTTYKSNDKTFWSSIIFNSPLRDYKRIDLDFGAC